MKVDIYNFLRVVKKEPHRFLIVHYSSQSLFDNTAQGFSPRITSICVMDFATQQTKSFAVHTVAEILNIDKMGVETRYDEIEKEMLSQFFDFLSGRRDRFWIHWNMRNLTYGFEHLEHRSKYLRNSLPPSVSVEQRINLNEVLKERYGNSYAPDPKMKNLILANGPLPPTFLDGTQEADAFNTKEFIRMHSSTISKVEFFRHVIILAQKGKLKTIGKNLGVRVDNLLESRAAKSTALATAIVGVLVSSYQAYLWLKDF